MIQPKLLLSLYWHMHQPDYRDSITGEYVLPWTYLHAIKDYSDMAYHIEVNPKARVSFNFVPILLDQLEDYAAQFKQQKIKDPLLSMLAADSLDCVSKEHCQLIVESCFKSHHEKMLLPYAQYQRLFNLYQVASQAGDYTNLEYFSSQYKADLLVWYHLAWMGESVKRTSPLIQALIAKGSQFTLSDRIALFNLIGEVIINLIPRYKALQISGQIEITSTPHHHPILPLLIDFKSTQDVMPNAPLPAHEQYIGGTDRAIKHLQEAKQSHKRRFGQEPLGMWPSEGAVSHASLLVMANQNVRWTASGEGVLANSLRKSHPDKALVSRLDYLYKPYKVSNSSNSINCFFRDDRLSDKIGFEYSKLHSADAVRDFVQSLEHIHQTFQKLENPVVNVILDGENAWEYFPYNGYYFLNELYAALVNHPNIIMVTPSEIVQAIKTPELSSYKITEGHLPEIAAGSWVYGSFSTWIGSKDKNRGWDLLCDAKLAYDDVLLKGQLNEIEIQQCSDQLSVCEGSDWFWWLGDYNASVSVTSFDQLFRRNLINLYHLLKLPAPDQLNVAISTSLLVQNGLSENSGIVENSGTYENSGTMRRGQES